MLDRLRQLATLGKAAGLGAEDQGVARGECGIRVSLRVALVLKYQQRPGRKLARPQ